MWFWSNMLFLKSLHSLKPSSKQKPLKIDHSKRKRSYSNHRFSRCFFAVRFQGRVFLWPLKKWLDRSRYPPNDWITVDGVGRPLYSERATRLRRARRDGNPPFPYLVDSKNERTSINACLLEPTKMEIINKIQHFFWKSQQLIGNICIRSMLYNACISWCVRVLNLWGFLKNDIQMIQPQELKELIYSNISGEIAWLSATMFWDFQKAGTWIIEFIESDF